MSKKDFYDILGLNKSAPEADIKSAYRKMALKYHPDRNKEPDAEEKFKEINEAYEVLSNPQKRQAYDQFGHAAFDPSSGGFGGHTYTNRQGPFTYTWNSGGEGGENPFGADFDFGGFSNPFDIFEQFFGGGFSQGRQKRRPHYKISLTFLESVNGVEKEVKLDGKSRKIKIPAGISDGQQIQFEDFILYVDVQPDATFHRDGNDVYVTQNLTIKQAILGEELEIPTLTKPLKIRVKPGTQPNTLIRLRGEGVKDVHGRGRGDLYVRLLVEIPTHLSREQQNLLKQLDI